MKWSVKNTEQWFLLTGGAQVQMENPVTKPMKMCFIPFLRRPSFMPRQIMGEREILVTVIFWNLLLKTRGGVRGGTRNGLPRDFLGRSVWVNMQSCVYAIDEFGFFGFLPCRSQMGVKRANKEKNEDKVHGSAAWLLSSVKFNCTPDINSAPCSPGGLCWGFAKLHLKHSKSS
jgi:hypothetical protein